MVRWIQTKSIDADLINLDKLRIVYFVNEKYMEKKVKITSYCICLVYDNGSYYLKYECSNCRDKDLEKVKKMLLIGETK